ncbi:MAG TPA: outer membrane protein transport protein [Fibrobacteria bacterium]|nr:outer membrane protein transport protein [Fibrobacteria bacterium]
MATKDKEKRRRTGAPRTGRKAAGAALAALLTAAALGTAGAEATGELVSLGKKTGVGARAIGLGEAFTAVADDYSALYYNAAGMTQLTRSEVGLNLSYGMHRNNVSFDNGAPHATSLEATKLNALNMVLTDGGRWALGLGYYTPVSFDDPLVYQSPEGGYAYNASGQMDHYRMALAYKVSEQVRLGFAVSAVTGEEQLEIRDGTTARYLEEYTGYNVEPSFLIHLSDMFSVGGSAVVMERLELTDTYQERGGSPLESVYDIHHPFQAKLGFAFQSGLTQVSADWHGDFWSSYSYRNAGDAFVDHGLNYPNKHTFNVGLEQHLDRRGPVLRLGYTWENQDDERPQPNQRDPYRVSVGAGFMPSKRVGLDFAYQYGGSRTVQNSRPGGPEDLSIEGEDHQVMASFRYRW